MLCCVDEVSNPEMSKPLIYRIQGGAFGVDQVCCTTPSLDSSHTPVTSISIVCHHVIREPTWVHAPYRQPPLAAVISHSCHPASHIFSLASRLLHSTHYLARTGLLERRAKTGHCMTDLGPVTKASKCTAAYLHVSPSHSPTIQRHPNDLFRERCGSPPVRTIGLK